MSVVGELGRPQRYGTLGAGIRILEVHGYLGMMILATGAKLLVRGPASGSPVAAGRRTE